jgi:hypothetical protein
MSRPTTCARCGHGLEPLRNPVERLRWTRFWWKGFVSLFTGQLSLCPHCGTIYSGDGELVASGAVETEAEQRLRAYRRDMAHLRDAFAGIVIAAELVVIWVIAGPDAFSLAKIAAAGSVGIGAFFPYAYFARKAHLAKRDLKQLAEARRRGQIWTQSGPQ